MNTKRILQRALPAAAATALLFAFAPASYASATASPAVSPQICLAPASVHPSNCEGHAPAGIYWFQGRAFDGSYQYLNLTYGVSLYYPTYQGDYVVVQ